MQARHWRAWSSWATAIGAQAILPAAFVVAQTPEEVVAIRQDFDWRTIDALPETDPDGNPALWHALIYIDRVVNDSADPPVRDQLDALDAWRVFYSPQPLSRTYVTELAGKCGRVSHATDGKGVVVYAVLPAQLFNILRSFAIEAELAGRRAAVQVHRAEHARRAGVRQ